MLKLIPRGTYAALIHAQRLQLNEAKVSEIKSANLRPPPDSLVRIVGHGKRIAHRVVTAIFQYDRRHRIVIGVGLLLFHLVYHALPVQHFTEDGVLSVEPRRRHGGDVKLASVGVRSAVRHRDEARAGVVNMQIFVLKIFPVDADRTMSITGDDVTA